MSEANIQREIMLAASAEGMTVWRNNAGKAWQGRRLDVSGATIILPSGSRIAVGSGILLSEPRIVEFGLCKGSSDIIGIRPVVIGPERVGRTLGQFVAIEVKSPGARVATHQRRFLERVDASGGLAFLARSPEDLK